METILFVVFVKLLFARLRELLIGLLSNFSAKISETTYLLFCAHWPLTLRKLRTSFWGIASGRGESK